MFASYGSRSSGALLLSYGFVPEGPNAHEMVDIDLSLLEADPLYAEKAQTLNACGLDHSRSFPLRLGAFPDGLVQVQSHRSSNLGTRALFTVIAERMGFLTDCPLLFARCRSCGSLF